MNEEKTIVYSYNKDTKIYTIDYKEMQKINKRLKERFTLKQENKQLKEVIEEVREVINKMIFKGYAKGGTIYMATTKDSEFGTRAKVLLQILDKAKEE